MTPAGLVRVFFALAAGAGAVACGSGDSDDEGAPRTGGDGGDDSRDGSAASGDATTGSTTPDGGSVDGASGDGGSGSGDAGDGGAVDGGLAHAISPQAFGLHILFTATPFPAIPFGGLRYWDNVTSWDDVEGADAGVYSWGTFDFWLTQAKPHAVHPMYTFGRPPPWASSKPTSSSGYGPGQAAPPTSLAVWDQWVTTVVDRSVASTGAHFDAYEIWNEPNSTTYWNGTLAQLHDLASSAYPLIHQHDPAAVVLTPAPSNINPGGAGDGVDWMDQWLDTGAAAAADVVSVHGYLYNGNSTCVYRQSDGTSAQSGMCANQLAANLVTLKTMLARHADVTGKPLWISETSWGSENDVAVPADALAQAAFLAQYYLTALSSGVSRVYWYGWDYAPIDVLWDAKSGVHASGVAYGEVEKWLVGNAFTAPCSATAANVWTCGLTNADGSSALAVWKSDGAASFTVPAGYGHARDITGVTSAVAKGVVAIDSRPLLLVP